MDSPQKILSEDCNQLKAEKNRPGKSIRFNCQPHFEQFVVINDANGSENQLTELKKMKVLLVNRSSIHKTLSIEVATARARFCELSFFVQLLKISSLPLKSPPAVMSQFPLRHSAIWHSTPFVHALFVMAISGMSVRPVAGYAGMHDAWTQNVSPSSTFDEANVTRAAGHESPVAIVCCNISL